MDANEVLDTRKGNLRKLIEDTTLVDTFSKFSNEDINIKTFAGGSTRIDYIFTSESLLKYVKRVGYPPFYTQNESDHRGAFIDLSNEMIDEKVQLK